MGAARSIGSQDNSGGKGTWGLLTNPVQSRVSYEIRRGYPGLYPFGS